MESILVPIFVCVVLPVSIVFLTMWGRRNEINKKTEIALKAIESGQQISSDLFRDSTNAPKTVKQSLLGKLTGACVTFALGTVLLAFGIIECSQTSWILTESPAMLLAISGAVLIAVGFALFFVFVVGKKMLAREIAAEEAHATKSE